MVRKSENVIEALDAKSDRRMVIYNGIQVCWRGFGEGRPMVLIHGGHGSWLHWERNIEALSRGHRVWVPDLPGFGDSDALDKSTPLSGLVEILAGSLDALIGENSSIDLVGFSFGGVVAAHLAAHRKGVARLALLGPTGHGGTRPQREALVNWRRSTDPETMLADLKQNMEVLMLHGPVDELALEIHRHSCVHTRFRSKEMSQSPALPGALDHLTIPILMLWGEHDSTGLPHEAGPFFKADRTNRYWSVIPGAGHWVQYEAAEEVNARLIEWFNVSIVEAT